MIQWRSFCCYYVEPIDRHPSAACVWDVAFLPNGDLVTACADYAARVWTASPDRAATSDIIEVGFKIIPVKEHFMTLSP